MLESEFRDERRVISDSDDTINLSRYINSLNATENASQDARGRSTGQTWSLSLRSEGVGMV